MPQDTPSPPPDDTQALLDYVADRDVPCPRCAYNLHGLTQPRCPECGEALSIQVGQTNTRLGAWIMSCAALLLIVGGNMLILMLAVEERGLRHLDTLSDFALLAIGLIALPMSISMVLRRRRFLRYKPLAQRAIAWTCWLAALYYFASYYEFVFGY